jgi:dTDP-4-dehydrorhamnose 3,5-epimerase
MSILREITTLRKNKMIKIEDTPFKDVRVFTTSVFEDFRGTYREIYHEDIYKGLGAPPFVTDCISESRKNVLRGFHGDFVTWKLVQCLHGEVYARIIDLNRGSETYWRCFSIVLSQHNHTQLLIPPGFGNSILALTDDVIYHYKQSNYYEDKQFTLRYDAIGVPVWPINAVNIVISDRDRNAARGIIEFENRTSFQKDLLNNPFINAL